MMKVPRLVILDRDGVINREQGHIRSREDFEIIDGVCDSIAALNKAGCYVCVASNQSGLARGILTEEALGEIQKYFESELFKVGGRIDHWFYSPWHPDVSLEGGVKKWLGEHEDRKPGTGMLKKSLTACQVNALDAVMVGDSRKDLQAAKALGIKFLGVKSDKLKELEGELVFNSLKETVHSILNKSQT